ncbi:hypothetical protein [Rhodococcoides fascians]|uniref:hypothetical protein n=1 Tax=Rhodococcoides fascians TaxID=1828 RepID=UPI00056BD8BD|nr:MULTISPECIES: hypothetical protein [Rhodococcus]OZE98098.1 hypothetical protein CH301_17295 [Rhodococcus sp. 15-1189-1-1a]OZF12748.1 hypothetical protein CH299_17980 [Rhodococcus sp. 14-2686-1-2]
MSAPLPDWAEMTYDEQRAFLGLPEVRGYVARYRIRRSFGLMAEVMGTLVLDIRDKFAPVRAAQEITNDYGLSS